MKNQELAKIFSEMSMFLKIKNVSFKPQAYEKAALNLKSLTEDVEKIYKREGKNGLKRIPGIGENIAEKIIEYLKGGKIKAYEKLKQKMPVKIQELTQIESVGPKMVAALYQHLAITNLKELEVAARQKKIRNLPNFGVKTEENILKSIMFLKRNKGRFLLGHIYSRVEEILSLLKNFKEVKKISIAGSARRMKETIGDIDILVTTENPKKVMDYFISLPEVIKIWDHGLTKSSVRMRDGFDVDLRVVKDREFGSALQYFTGSKEHNIALRKIAIEKGLKLNEYGIFKGKKRIAGKTEEEIYAALGLPYIEPEMRTNTGEIETALRQTRGKHNGLPKIINYNSIKGDLHIHSNWNGGEDFIKEIAKVAQDMGYEYIGISDHTKFLRIEHGLNEKQLLAQHKEIRKLNREYSMHNTEFRILHGCEANILEDGTLDINDKVLSQLDYVIAGVHSQMKMPKKQMTERIIRAMRNPNVDIISHPTGRLIKRRDEYAIDFDKILEVAKETNIALEINSFPDRLDLKDTNIKKAVEQGVKLIINTDSHSINHLGFIKFGIGQARRGWATKKDIINTWPLKKIKKFFEKKV